jgi:hypothetical protein
MTSKTIVLRVLDGIFVTFTMVLILWIGGLPIDWISNLVDMPAGEFHWFAMFAVFAALWLIHAIATSDSAP